jgi:RNA polymerase sigma-70 factor (ECF subfamily)
MNNLTDDELISLIKNWNSELFWIISSRYLQKLSNYVYRMVNFNSELVDDLVYEIFLKVWKNLDKYAWGSFNAWIFKLAHWEIVNFIWKNTQTYFDETKLIQSTSFDLNNIDTKFKWKLLMDLLDKLWEDSKEILILYYFENKDYEEIWNIVWKPKNTIWTIISRAKIKLKEYITKDDWLLDALLS